MHQGLSSLPHTALVCEILLKTLCVRQLKVSRYICVWHWVWHLLVVQQILIPALFLVHLLLFSLNKLLLLTGSSSACVCVSRSGWFLFSFPWLLSLTKFHPLIYYGLIDMVFSTTVRMSTSIYLLSFSCWVFLFPLWCMTFLHVT